MQGTREALRARRLRRVAASVGFVIAVAAIGPVASASAAVVGTTNPNTVAGAILSGGTGAFVFTPGSDPGPTQAGTGNTPLAGFPTALSTFGILTSGDSELADDPNSSESDGDSLAINDPARGDANDAITLRIDFTVPAGNTCLLLDYKFLSEEFPEFVGSRFNDAFIAELDSPSNWNASGQTINAPRDFAAGYGTQISVNGVGPTAVSPADSAGTTYDAATKTIVTKAPVTAGAHSLFLSIFDASDHIYDSAVFLDNLRFNTETPATCKSPDVFEGAVGAGPAKKQLLATDQAVIVPIECNLPAAATAPCVGTAGITANVTGGAVAARKLRLTKKKNYSVQPARKRKVKLTLTRRGRAVLRKRGRIRGKLVIRNTVNGTSKITRVRIRRRR